MRPDRRAFIGSLASCFVTPAVHARAAQPNASALPSAESGFEVHELAFAKTSRTMQRTRVYVPHGLTNDREWPVAVLLHGYAQARTDERALAAWRAEYNVLEAYETLVSGEVPPTPSLGAARADEISGELQTQPFAGMVLVTPVTPIPYFQRDLGQALARYADWIHSELLPGVASIAPISTAPEHIGLSGVSMGGLVGLELMWRFPERFGAYCGIQIAIKRTDAQRYAWLLRKAFSHVEGGHGRPIRVVTATRDTYRWSNQAFYKALIRNNLDASLELRKGTHTSRWMRQAGSLESLLWLDRTLNHGRPHK